MEKQVIDKEGFRAGVAMIIINERNELFWARRKGQRGWQFPQGGLADGETPREAMFRELHEEVGLTADDVEIVAESKRWLRYYLPRHLVRQHQMPLCIGQKQKWFLLRLRDEQVEFCFDKTASPEFDGFCWVDYWFPLKQVVFFKRKLYKLALREFSSVVLNNVKSIT